jgi:hypothetical protein
LGFDILDSFLSTRYIALNLDLDLDLDLELELELELDCSLFLHRSSYTTGSRLEQAQTERDSEDSV